MSNIKVSVIVPVYNQERYIEKCIESICRQTLKDIEIIIINDGSTDNTQQILERLKALDSRISLINKANSGYGASVNIGIEKAQGKYIGIVESDDFIAENMYEYLYNLNNNDTVDIVKGNFYDVYSGNNFITNTEKVSVKNNIETNVTENPSILYGHPCVWSAIYKADFIKNNSIRFLEDPGACWVDNPFFFETIFRCRSFIYTKEPLYFYNHLNENSSSNKLEDPILPMRRMLDNLEIYEKYGKKYENKSILKFLYGRALNYINHSYAKGDYKLNYKIINEWAYKLAAKLDNLDIIALLPECDKITFVKARYPESSKILIYNWAPFYSNEGGGVSVYCRNLIDLISKYSPNTQIYFLSSGYAYDTSKANIFIRRLFDEWGKWTPNIYQFEVVNSPVPACQRHLYKNPLVALKNEGLKETIRSFISSHGKFDVIHFQNIEGLSLDVFDLKEEFKDTKFIFSLHNYIPICLTGSYYQRHTHKICSPDHSSEDCLKCSRVDIWPRIADNIFKRSSSLLGAKNQDWYNIVQIAELEKNVLRKDILKFSKTATEKLNRNCDFILSPSNRTREIAIANGFLPEKIFTSYIGTKVASEQLKHSNKKHNKESFKLLYLGSIIGYEEKGYKFLLEALSKLDIKYASKIDLVLTAKDDPTIIKNSLKNFKSLTIKNGYSHADLPDLCSECDLSIIPVVWEDNLPQIAIESVAYGVPLLASDAGGASELCGNPLFKFKSGDIKDFLNRLIYFLENPEKLNLFWESHSGIVTLEQHWSDLNNYYNL